MNTDIDILLANYFSGEASAAELAMLEDWLAESDVNQVYFDEMTLVYEKSAQAIHPPRSVDSAKAWNKFEQYMQQSESNNYRSKTRPIQKKINLYIQAAAILVILITTSIFVILPNKNNDSIHIASTESSLKHIMPDNSVVLLSQNSSITYDQNYGSSNRNVSLTGKASFDVGNEGEGKLIVSIGEVFIEDIGTVFTVDEYSDSQNISVSVESGIVLFYTTDNDGLNLYEGETGLFNKSTKRFSKQIAGIAVKPYQIVFSATPLHKVIERLSQQFGTTIILTDADSGNRQITVSFNENESIENILQVVAETLRLNIKYENGSYFLSSL